MVMFIGVRPIYSLFREMAPAGSPRLPSGSLTGPAGSLGTPVYQGFRLENFNVTTRVILKFFI